MKYVDRILDMVNNPKSNHHPTGLEKLDKVIHGFNPGSTTVIMGSTGSGKSAFALFTGVYAQLYDQTFKGRIVYYSLEMGVSVVLARLMSIRLQHLYSITITQAQILGFENIENKDKITELIKKEEGWLDYVQEHLTVKSRSYTAPELIKDVNNILMAEGSVDSSNKYSRKDGGDTIFIIDHVGLISGSPLKTAIDMVSRELTLLRERYGIIVILVQQTNRENGDINRFKMNKSAFTVNDAKDTSNTINDCTCLIGLFDPLKEGITYYQKYDTTVLNGGFRACQVLKNRYGIVGVEVPLMFHGMCGSFCEIPAGSLTQVLKPIIKLK